MMSLVDINLVAVLVAAVVGFGIGMLWYSPLLFSKMWMSLSGLTAKDMGKAKKKGMMQSMVLGFLSLLVMNYVLAHLVDYMQAKTAMEGMQAGFWLWLGFIATVMLGSVLWENKSWKLYLLNVAHYLVVLLASGAILAVWA